MIRKREKTPPKEKHERRVFAKEREREREIGIGI